MSMSISQRYIHLLKLYSPNLITGLLNALILFFRLLAFCFHLKVGPTHCVSECLLDIRGIVSSPVYNVSESGGFVEGKCSVCNIQIRGKSGVYPQTLLLI